MRRNFAEFGSFVVVSEALPFTKGAKLAMLGLPLVLTVGPQFNEEVLSNPSVWRPVGLFPGGARNSAARRLGAGLARMSGPRHAHFRHLLLPPLRKVSVEALAEKMAALAVDDVATWPVEKAIDLWPLVCRLMHSLAIGLMFGNDKEHGYPIAQMISDLIALKWSPSVRACPIGLPVTPYGRMVRESERLERCILDWANTKRGSLDGGDLLSIVVNNVEEDGNAIRDDTIVGVMPQLFGAVFETCQDLLIWTLVLLSQHPSTARGLLEELQDRFADSPPNLQGIVELPRLDAVIKESLRILPPVPMQVRVAQQDTSLAGHPFPMGSRVMLSAFVTNRLPDHYPEPDTFRPERWVSINPSPFEYLVFSAGPRKCPGFYLGLAMVKMAVATIFLHFRIELESRTQIDYIARPALKPRGKIRAILHAQDGEFAAVPVNGNILGLVRSLQ